jgi:hypothetical protein
VAAEVAGPPQTQEEAAINAILTIVGGGVASKAGRGATVATKSLDEVGEAATTAERAFVGASHRRTGQTVLGSYPGYIDEGERLGARYFNVPPQHYAKLSPDERWAANARFLDRTVARGDDVLLTNKARSGTTFAREVAYLGEQGYAYADELRLVLRR